MMPVRASIKGRRRVESALDDFGSELEKALKTQSVQAEKDYASAAKSEAPSSLVDSISARASAVRVEAPWAWKAHQDDPYLRRAITKGFSKFIQRYAILIQSLADKYNQRL